MRVPLEVVLMIVEEAAHQQIAHRRGYVASLCRICHFLKAPIERILYHSVRFDRAALEWTSTHHNSHFVRHTQRLLIPDSVVTFSPRNAGDIVSTFTNIEFLLCNTSSLRDLYYGRVEALPFLQPKALFFKGRWWRHPQVEIAFFAILHSVTHLALSNTALAAWLELYSRLHQLKVSHVLLEIAPSLYDSGDGLRRELQELRLSVEYILDLPSLQRLVCRCAYGSNEHRAVVKATLHRVAATRRELRIAFIEMSVTPAGPYSFEVVPADAFENDMAAGYDVWYAGAALYEDAESIHSC